MPTDGFWALLERTRPAGDKVEEHAAAVTEALVGEGVDATLAWARDLDEALDALDHWDVWGVAFLALGGCSDDAYEYTRCWIVSHGREAWDRARADPEGFVASLFEGVATGDDVWRRVEELGGMDGEPLRYAAGIAHERLTGSWLPPRPAGDGSVRPRGVPWEEDALPERYPRLASVLPGDWWQAATPASTAATPALAILEEVAAALTAFEHGDHVAVVAGLGPVLDDPARWDLLAAHPDVRVDAAYAGGISRLSAGDPDGAAAWLRLVSETPDLPPHVRRALTQIELARGELGAAKALLDDDAGASLLDQALRMAVAFREGDRDDARRRAEALAHDVGGDVGRHPWDLAGIHVQLGFAFVELGDAPGAAAAADAIERLTAGAPPEVPLLAQGRIVRAGASRLSGDLDGAAGILDSVRGAVAEGTCDRGLAEREHARVLRARGLDGPAQDAFATAAGTFRAAGERWYADAALREARAA